MFDQISIIRHWYPKIFYLPPALKNNTHILKTSAEEAAKLSKNTRKPDSVFHVRIRVMNQCRVRQPDTAPVTI